MISISLVLNAAKKDVAGVVHAVQGENGARQLDIKICDADGAIMNLAEYTATFYVLKPDDTVVQTPMNVSGDTASVILSLQACAVAGNCLCWVQIVKSGALDLRTDNLVLQVQPCDFDGAIESTNEFTALTQAIEDAQQATSNANAAADEARETAESTAESVINSQKGQPNGIATLDSSGKLAQMPSGVLPVGNGGTGKSSWVPSQLIYPSATSALSQLGFPSVSGSFLRQGTSGAPYWSSPSTVLSAIGALGEDDQAADSAKLGGQLPAYYSNYNNLTNKPSIPSATSTTPKPLGTATVGTSTYYARADHVHKMPSASDVGALPTSYIDSGSNSNGMYIKFGDGTMICTKQFAFTSTFTGQEGAMYYGTRQSLGNYAASFASLPAVCATISNGASAFVDTIKTPGTTTIGTINLYRNERVTTENTVTINIIAIGRWKN